MLNSMIESKYKKSSMRMVYWVSTFLTSAILAMSAVSYLFHGSTIDGIRDLGFPDYFRIQLAILKIIAIVVLLVPVIPLQFKEWAYAGCGLFYLTAIVAHIAHRDSYLLTALNLIFIAILVVSNVFLKKAL